MGTFGGKLRAKVNRGRGCEPLRAVQLIRRKMTLTSKLKMLCLFNPLPFRSVFYIWNLLHLAMSPDDSKGICY